MELVGRRAPYFTKIDQKTCKNRQIYIWTPWLSDLLCKHWFASSVWNFCRWVADVPLRETSPAAKGEEKRTFLQATALEAKPESYVNNGNWTEWSAIWSEIIRVISKLNERAARVRFEITSMISDQNCTTRSSITTLLHPFWNRRILSVLMFYWSSSRFVKKPKHKGFYISFCIRNRNDAKIYIEQKWCNLKQKWCDLEHEWRDLEQMRFSAKNGAI